MTFSWLRRLITIYRKIGTVSRRALLFSARASLPLDHLLKWAILVDGEANKQIPLRQVFRNFLSDCLISLMAGFFLSPSSSPGKILDATPYRLIKAEERGTIGMHMSDVGGGGRKASCMSKYFYINY